MSRTHTPSLSPLSFPARVPTAVEQVDFDSSEDSDGVGSDPDGEDAAVLGISGDDSDNGGNPDA